MKSNMIWVWITLMIIGTAALSVGITSAIMTKIETPDEKAAYLEAYMDGYNNRSLGLPQDSTLFFDGFNTGAEYIVRFMERADGDTITVKRGYGDLQLIRSIKLNEPLEDNLEVDTVNE